MEEQERLAGVAKRILSRIEELAASEGVLCQAILVGSAARGTWLTGDHDLDVFIGVSEGSSLLPPLEVARRVAPVYEERYAEHAYVHARFEGFEIDIVPCYLVEDASRILSAVDRTPFHSRYVSRRIKGLEDEVLLLKQFMKGIGVYGSELKVGGFSGYLAELLVIRYGSFLKVLEGASLWRPGETIDLEGRSSLVHEDPLIVVDPVDPGRNVAAALTLDRMFTFVAASRLFLEEPDLDFFFPTPVLPLSDDRLREVISDRRSTLVLLEFAGPDQVEDVVFPQLRKAEQSVCALLDRSGFSVLRSDADWHRGVQGGKSTAEASYSEPGVRSAVREDEAEGSGPEKSGGCGIIRMLFELEVAVLSRVEKRVGPPIWEAEHAKKFVKSHPGPLSGPYVEGGRVVVEEARKFVEGPELLRARVAGLSLGRHLGPQLRCGYKIYVDQEILKVGDPEFRVFLARYFSARQMVG
ncbi:MAG TPA: CCA tRNA nucleotidyltransferase [Methanothrix sp.]|nr:CCA tRNA nucleotidyltransferase [Methanothrix sp.]